MKTLGKVIAVVGAAVFFAMLSVLAIGGIGPAGNVWFLTDTAASPPSLQILLPKSLPLGPAYNGYAGARFGGTTGGFIDFVQTPANTRVGTIYNTVGGGLNVSSVAGTMTFGSGNPGAFSATAGAIGFPSFGFAGIASNMTTNGQIGYCSDCTIANPCASGGTGAFVKRLNGVNVCN